jgi:murein DD-endopeptidase MepM/ murein hydrolase activator NlpD
VIVIVIVIVWCGAGTVGFNSTALPACARVGSWSRPVNGPVVRGFEPPATRFGPGHLGVDYATGPGTPVRAAGAGVVVFAGRVGTGLFVVVSHPGTIRTTDSFLATIAVVDGQVVARGAILGTTGGNGPGHGSGVLHFSVRVGATYIDPMLLFAPPDLGAVVHLAPPRGGAAAQTGSGSGEPSERAAIADAVRSAGAPRTRSTVVVERARDRAGGLDREGLRLGGMSLVGVEA